jgi:hypothetical protein
MNVVDRKNRSRKRSALLVTENEEPRIAAVAKGCVQHHDDDQLFHQGPTFLRLSTELAIESRSDYGVDPTYQAGFLGHIVVELVLDTILCERHPGILDRFYEVFDNVDAELVQTAASLICPKPVTTLADLIKRFVKARFLEDYLNDEGLLRRLSGVMTRVQLPKLPETLTDWLPSVRYRVRAAADELLAGI